MSRDEQGHQKQKMTFGLIVGNRGFFPDHLAKTGARRNDARARPGGHRGGGAQPEEGKYGAVETHEEAQRAPRCFARSATGSTASS